MTTATMARSPRASWQREDTSEGSSYLAEILKLHNAGVPSTLIGKKFGKDHTTILYHLRKMGVSRGIGRGHRRPLLTLSVTITTIEIGAMQPAKRVSKYDHVFNEPVNPGKTYKEYLQKAGKSDTEIRHILAQKANAARSGGASYELPHGFHLAD